MRYFRTGDLLALEVVGNGGIALWKLKADSQLSGLQQGGQEHPEEGRSGEEELI